MPISAEQNQLKEAQKPFERDQQSISGPMSFSGSTQSQSPSQSRIASSQSGQQGSGSGRFVNLQQYMSANQGSGERLASGIGGRLNQERQQLQSTAEKTGQAITAQKQTTENLVNKGQSFKEQLEKGDFNPSNIAQTPTQLGEFTSIRTGSAIPSDFTAKAQAATNAQMNLQNKLNENLTNLKTDSGRFGLLKQAFGGLGGNYGIGKQKLDELFLQTSGQRGLTDLQKQVGQQLGTQKQIEQKIAGDIGATSQNIANIQNLGSTLQSLATGGESKFMQAGEGRVAGINQSIDQEVAKAQKAFNILTGKESGDLALGDLMKLGLQSGQQTWGLLGPGSQFTLEQAYDIDPRRAGSFKDIATQADINRAADWSKLTGGPAQLTNLGQLINPSTGKFDSSEFIKGKTTIADQLAAKQKEYNDILSQTAITGSSADWNPGLELLYGDRYSNTVANLLAGNNPTLVGRIGQPDIITSAEATTNQARRLQDYLNQIKYGELLGSSGVTHQDYIQKYTIPDNTGEYYRVGKTYLMK